MLINATSLDLVFTGFKTVFAGAFDSAPSHFQEIATTVTSTGREELYGWLGEFPALREWLGDRIVHNLEAHDFTIKNRKFEATVSVNRDNLEDDKVGVYKPMFQEMGRGARQHPDKLVFSLLASGASTPCYDGQNFFDTDHPVTVDGVETSVSNYATGGGPMWVLLDTSRAVKPIIWQERVGYQLQHLARDNDEHVFMKDEYLYGIRARVNAGFGLWQMAHASKAVLDAANYEAARQAMMDLTDANGDPLGIVPDTLVVGTGLEGDARRLIKKAITGGDTNEWADSAKLIITPWFK